jgi:hypothetical protein
MGQYFKPTCIEKFEAVSSHDFGQPSKLTETAWLENKYIHAVEKLLAPKGRWHKTHFCWAGDYTEAKLFLPDHVPEKDEKGYDINIYNYEGMTNIKPESGDYGRRGKFLVNHTKHSYINLKKETACDGDGWIIHPLPILTATSNGQGGGDYHGCHMNIVGCWMGDVISIESKPPVNFKLLAPCDFKEGKEEGNDVVPNSTDYEKVWSEKAMKARTDKEKERKDLVNRNKKPLEIMQSQFE